MYVEEDTDGVGEDRVIFDYTQSYKRPYLVGSMPGILGATLMFLMPSQRKV